MSGLLIYDGARPQYPHALRDPYGCRKAVGDIAVGGYVFYEMGDGMYKCSQSIVTATGVKYITAQVTYERTRAKCLAFLSAHNLIAG